VISRLPQAPHVRAAGSGWSLSGVVVPPTYTGFLVETDQLDATIYDIIPECLSEPVLEALRSQPERAAGEIDEASFNLYHVEAGVKLNRLYSRLDRRPHPHDEPWNDFPTDRSALTSDVAALGGPWALPTLGGAGGQSIAGAFSTSTHGGDIRLPPIADAVVAIHLVGCEGRQYWIEPSSFLGRPKDRDAAPLTDDRKLRDSLPGVTIIRDSALFDAVLVSTGRMGIIYSVVLRIVRQYGLGEVRRHHTWEGEVEELVRRLDMASEPFDHRFVQIVLNPHARADGQHSAWVTTRDVAWIAEDDETAGRQLRSGANAGAQSALGTDSVMSTICGAANAGEVLAPALAFLAGAALTAGAVADLFVPGLGPIIAAPILTLDGALTALTLPGWSGTLGDLISEACNIVVGAVGTVTDAEPLIGLINEEFLSLGQSPEGVAPDQPLTDVSYAVLDRWNYIDRNCENSADSLEVAFPASSPQLLEWINLMFAAARDLTNGTLHWPGHGRISGPLAFAGYASLRFTGLTRATIGIERWEPTCIVEVAGLKALDGIAPFLDRIEADAKSLGATVHWGQRNSLTLDEVDRMYPGIEQWRSGLGRLSRNGLEQTFSTTHTQQRGLEVVQPRFAAFSVARAFVCASEEVTARWDAEENPPGTTVTIHLETPSHTFEAVDVDRAGEQATPVGRGRTRIWATAQAPLPDGSGRQRVAMTPIYDVHAFSGNADRYRVGGQAESRSIDGSDRWAVEVTLRSQDWSASLYAGNLYLAPSSPPITVRRDGYEDVPLRAGVGVEFLPADPSMIGTWLLFTRNLDGPAPTLEIDVDVHC